MDLTFVCCIEAGRLETQTLNMVGSLRRFAGAMSDLPVIAVVGRRGAPLQRHTLRRLEELQVQLVSSKTNPVSWLGYGNKIAAVLAAQQLAQTESIAWIDSDVLFAREPKGLILPDGCDFAARIEHLPPAVSKDDHRNEPYWRAVSSLFGIDFTSIPWIGNQRMYFNSGIFVWRRRRRFAENYAHAFAKLLRSRLATASGAFHFADQVALTPVVMEMSWKHLDQNEHFMIFEGFIDGPSAVPTMENAEIIHYSRSFDPPHQLRMTTRLKEELPCVHDWLCHQDTYVRKFDFRDPFFFVLKIWRGLRYRLFKAHTIKV